MKQNNQNEALEEETYGYTLDTQKKIAAFLITNQNIFEENIGLVKPEYFGNPVVSDIVKLIINFFNKYSRLPTEDELLQELDVFLTNTEKRRLSASVDEYLDIYEEIITLSRNGNFDYISDLIVDFGLYQVFYQATSEVIHLLVKKDYNGIVNAISRAAAIGCRDGELRKLSEIEAKEVEWLWENHIPLGELTLLIGDPGTGKSYFSYFISAQVTKEGFWPNAPDKPIESGKVLILSTDEDPNYAIRPRAEAAGADIDKIFVLEGSRDETGRIKILNLTNDIIRLENILKKDKGYRLVLIDPLSDYIGHVDTHKYSDVRWALAPILALARKYKVAIIGIMHCNKNTSLQVLYRIMGSIGFASVARNIWLIAKDPADEEEKKKYFVPLKNNLAPPQKPLAFHLENQGKVGRVIIEIKPVEDNFDVEDVLAPLDRVSETKRAKKFLIDTLRDGGIPVKDIQRAARENAIS